MSEKRRATNPFTSNRLKPIQWAARDRFAHPMLAERPPLEQRQMGAWAARVRKSCAGLAHRWRADPEQVREALASDRWDERVEATVAWMAPGEPLWMLPWWYEECGLSLLEIVRMRMRVSPAWDSWAPWLNVWAANPEEPKPWTGMWGYQHEYEGATCIAEPDRPPW